jgi:hypothetical protein
MTVSIHTINKKYLLLAVTFTILTSLAFFGIRFALLEKKEVHYHANFAVFVEGERLPFDTFTFYEEVAACGGNGLDSPKIRVHMHDNINHVIHVHDSGATWGHFFANLNFVHGDTVFKTDKATYLEDGDTQIRFFLNDEEVQTTANRTIGNEDVLLISIGNPTDEDLQNQYAQIQRDAAEYNEKDDPSACSGGKPFTLGERLKTTVKFWE